MKKLAGNALLVAAALSLGGCGWLFGKTNTSQAKNWVAPQPDRQAFAQTQLAEGRKALDNNDNFAAIVAFSNAQGLHTQAAEAHNGMAIAYARLGRPDVAARYFAMAVLEAPEDPRYRANLALLQQRERDAAASAAAMLAAQSAPSTSNAGDAPVRTASNSRDAGIPGIRIERPRSRLVRTGNGEIVLTTRSPAPGAEKERTLALSGAPERK